jgi:catalase (peroxidase I)
LEPWLFENLFGYEWELTQSPAGAYQWKPKDDAGAGTVPEAHDASKRRAPAMLTIDLALRFDPAYEMISREFWKNPQRLAEAFARAFTPGRADASQADTDIASMAFLEPAIDGFRNFKKPA